MNTDNFYFCFCPLLQRQIGPNAALALKKKKKLKLSVFDYFKLSDQVLMNAISLILRDLKEIIYFMYSINT